MEEEAFRFLVQRPYLEKIRNTKSNRKRKTTGRFSKKCIDLVPTANHDNDFVMAVVMSQVFYM